MTLLPFQLFSVEGVLSFRDEHFWRHSSNVVGGTIHVQVKPDVSEQKVISQVHNIKFSATVPGYPLTTSFVC